ncbi:homoserine dehydrogenase-like protein [Hydrogenivirga caldilitoris]|uniref:Homoserine dehydrogenase-like protein n=1 Tax=Hydrogenivirga caldilitoris TaxID=246264 RepID=A0A497XQI3_9AQUI|nr:serine kinase [Hydrogenivirga caldilitoris]RLJ70541.1 homoserine dehydrogenase-like protein [Hydrogenivirga caldilitoris]
MRTVKVAIAGLGKVGSVFLDALLEAGAHNIKVVAVAEPIEEKEAVRKAKEAGAGYFKDARNLLEALGDEIDVLFDLTGDAVLRTELHEILSRQSNRNTVIVPEKVAYLVWALITKGEKVYPR